MVSVETRWSLNKKNGSLLCVLIKRCWIYKEENSNTKKKILCLIKIYKWKWFKFFAKNIITNFIHKLKLLFRLRNFWPTTIITVNIREEKGSFLLSIWKNKTKKEGEREQENIQTAWIDCVNQENWQWCEKLRKLKYFHLVIILKLFFLPTTLRCSTRHFFELKETTRIVAARPFVKSYPSIFPHKSLLLWICCFNAIFKPCIKVWKMYSHLKLPQSNWKLPKRKWRDNNNVKLIKWIPNHFTFAFKCFILFVDFVFCFCFVIIIIVFVIRPSSLWSLVCHLLLLFTLYFYFITKVFIHNISKLILSRDKTSICSALLSHVLCACVCVCL